MDQPSPAAPKNWCVITGPGTDLGTRQRACALSLNHLTYFLYQESDIKKLFADPRERKNYFGWILLSGVLCPFPSLIIYATGSSVSVIGLMIALSIAIIVGLPAGLSAKSFKEVYTGFILFFLGGSIGFLLMTYSFMALRSGILPRIDLGFMRTLLWAPIFSVRLTALWALGSFAGFLLRKK